MAKWYELRNINSIGCRARHKWTLSNIKIKIATFIVNFGRNRTNLIKNEASVRYLLFLVENLKCIFKSFLMLKETKSATMKIFRNIFFSL